MPFIENGRVVERRSIMRAGTIADVFWGLLNTVYAFFHCMFSVLPPLSETGEGSSARDCKQAACALRSPAALPCFFPRPPLPCAWPRERRQVRGSADRQPAQLVLHKTLLRLPRAQAGPV
jgi:hypothetical protein